MYENNWYSSNQNPEQNSGEGEVWTLKGSCDPNLTPAPTPYLSGSNWYATRFWDCCKPHYAWDSNVPSGMSPLETCTINGVSINPDPDDQSACTDGSSYMCYKYLPWAVNSTLSYGFDATSSGDVCGKYFELQFTGECYHGANPGAAAINQCSYQLLNRFSFYRINDSKTCRFPATDPYIELHVDHIKPYSKGGETELNNLQNLCNECNQGKSNKFIV